jgi:5'-deoxynucleotidase YfbR-like HD superfamily hydrolase
MTSKILISLANLESSFEILEKLRFTPGNEELNDLWNYLIEVRVIQINALKENDTFGLVNDIKRTKSKNVAVQSENLRQENQQTRYISQSYSYSDK